MANKYCNLDGSKKIKDEYKKINVGFDKVEEDLVNIIVTPAEGVSEQEIVQARKGKSTLNDRLNETDTNINTVDSKVNTVKNNLDSRIDNIIATPTTVSEQEIIDARQSEISLGANLTSIKNDITRHKEEYVQQNLTENMVILELSNGVKNEFRINEDGQYEFIQRIREMVIDGNTPIYEGQNPLGENVYRFMMYTTNVGLGMEKKAGMDNLKVNNLNYEYGVYITDIEGYSGHPTNSRVYLNVNLSKLNAHTLNSVNEWLSNNPLNLIYELKEPKIYVIGKKSANTRELVRLSLANKAEDKVGDIINRLELLENEEVKGLNEDIPSSATMEGRMYLAIDTGEIFISTGLAWQYLGVI